MADGKFISEAERGRLDLSPVSGPELHALAIKTLSAPAEVLALARKAME